MISQLLNPSLEAFITQVVNELGYDLVEASITSVKQGKEANIFIYKKDGVGLKDCSQVASALSLHFQANFPELSINFNVSTPGIDRQFKSNHEYRIFIDHIIEGYTTDRSYFTGNIVSVDDNGFYLNDKDTFIVFDTVTKAKLKSKF